MKAVTIAKIARIIIAVSIVIILAIPTYGGIQSFKVTNGELVATNSVYELQNMSSSDLSTNIQNAIKDGSDLKSGYTISYGTSVGTPVPNVKGDIDTLAATIIAAYNAHEATTATLLDPDGNVAKQQLITGSGDMNMYVYTGLKLTGSVVNTVTPEITLNSSSGGHTYKISDVELIKSSDSYTIKMKIPGLLLATAMSGKDAKINIDMGIMYNRFFRIDLSLDLPTNNFTASGGSTPISADIKENQNYDGVVTKESIELNIDMVDTGELVGKEIKIGDYDGTEGGVRVKVASDGKIIIMADKEKIQEALQSSREEDGSLTVKISGMDDVKIDASYVDTLISMSGMLIDQWKEASP